MSVLPAGTRFWIWPEYRLEHEGNTASLPYMTGVILSLLITHMGKPVPIAELFYAMHGHREDGGPEGDRILVRTQMHMLKKTLRAYGINADIGRAEHSFGYRLVGFSTCEPVIEDQIIRGRRGWRKEKEIAKEKLSSNLKHRARRIESNRIISNRHVDNIQYVSTPKDVDSSWTHNARYEQRDWENRTKAARSK